MVINLANPSKSEEETVEPPVDSLAAERESEPREEQADVGRSEDTDFAQSGTENREGDVNDSTRTEFLKRRKFRELFYSRGLSPAQVMDLLDLSSEHVGTLMRIHGVGGFGHNDISEERISSLKQDLPDEEYMNAIRSPQGRMQRARVDE